MTAADQLATIADLVRPIADYWQQQDYSTHYEGCHQRHAGCLALAVLQLAEEHR